MYESVLLTFDMFESERSMFAVVFAFAIAYESDFSFGFQCFTFGMRPAVEELLVCL